MTDFPGVSLLQNTGILSPWGNNRSHAFFPSAVQSAATVWPAANRAIYQPVLVEDPVVVTKMAIFVSTQSGNLDVGIYSENGARLVSSGSTAVGAGTTVQAIEITDTTLGPGVYFFAMCVDNITAAFNRSTQPAGLLQCYGVQQQAVGAVTLPDPATFANPATAYVPAIAALCTGSVI